MYDGQCGEFVGWYRGFKGQKKIHGSEVKGVNLKGQVKNDGHMSPVLYFDLSPSAWSIFHW